jgi:single-stranded-DNA-specific exonuclease
VNQTVWEVFEANDLSHKIATHLRCLPIVAQLMLNRQVATVHDAQSFLTDTWDEWPLLPNQSELMAHIQALVDHQAAICVYGDYDVDGVTSTAILVTILRQLGCRVDYIAPHRFTDGYGLNPNRMIGIAERGYDALITVDCGVSNYQEIEALKQMAPTMVVLIIDHHKCPATLPKADAIVNPQLAEPDHPARHLCAAALVDYLFRTSPIAGADVDDYADLVAIGLVADVMPLTRLNRWYVKRGLARIQSQPREALRSLCITAGINTQHATAQTIGFGIGPRLNAPGRLGDPKPVVEWLLSTDPTRVNALVRDIEAMNLKRRSIGDTIQADIDNQLAEDPTEITHKGLFLSGQYWHMGIIGINASRLVNRYNKPVVIVAFDGDMARGSARSVPGVNMYAILKECSQYLTHFGGHSQAAGFSLHAGNIPAFKQAYREACDRAMDHSDSLQRLRIDAILPLSQVSLDFIDAIDQLAPFGEGNPQPLFYADATMVEARSVGQKKNHIKFRFTQDTAVMDGIGFDMADRVSAIRTQRVWVAFHVSKNDFGGQLTPQLQVIDIKAHEH